MLLVEAGAKIDMADKVLSKFHTTEIHTSEQSGQTPLDLIGERGSFIMEAGLRWERWLARRGLVLFGAGVKTLGNGPPMVKSVPTDITPAPASTSAMRVVYSQDLTVSMVKWL